MRFLTLPRAAALLGVALLGAVLTLVLTSPDRLPELTPEALADARERWRERGPAGYRMELAMSGSELAPAVYRVTVEGGAVTSVRRDGEPVSGELGWYGVAGLLDTLDREIELAREPSRNYGAPAGYRAWLFARFDPDTGVPERFRRVVGGTSRWSEWEVTGIEPATDPGRSR